MAAVSVPELVDVSVSKVGGIPVTNRGITNKMFNCSYRYEYQISMLQPLAVFTCPIITLFISGDQRGMETGNETTLV